MPKIIVLALESDNGDTLNASHAIIELTPELEEKLNKRVELLTELLKGDDKPRAIYYKADDPLFLPIDEQIVRGEPAIQEITEERLKNIKRFDEMLEISLGDCEMLLWRNGESPAEIRLYLYEKYTGHKISTDEFLWAGKTPFKLVPEAEKIKQRLEYLRGELRAERISWGEIAELQSYAAHIPPDDVELLEAAGVPETPADCYAAMIAFAREDGFEFVDEEIAIGELREACGGNANDKSEPFSDENYKNWAARLVANHFWTIDGKQLKEAREAWLANAKENADA